MADKELADIVQWNIYLQESDHLVVQVLGHAVGLVMLEEGVEVQFCRDLLPGLAGEPGLAVHGDHQASLLQPLLTRGVNLIPVLL